MQKRHLVFIVLASAVSAGVHGASPGKPGAPVQFEYAFRGEPKAGQSMEVEVKVTPTAPVDVLEIELQGSPGLVIEKGGGRHALEKPETGAARSFVVRVRPASGGVHDLELRAITRLGNRERTRAMGIEIPVGAGARRAKAPHGGRPAGNGADAVVVMPAETERRDR